MRNRSEVVWAGLGLIGLGIVMMLAFWIGWDKVWPVFIVFAGLGFLAGYVVGGFRESGFVFVGTAAVLVGLFFFGFAFGYWEWGDMAKLWPVFPLIGGVAFFALFIAERAKDMGTLGVGCVALIGGVVGLTITFGLVGRDIVKLWPLLLILVGVISLLGALLQASRRKK